MSNGSSITQFILLAFADAWELQLLHICLFLGIYLFPLLGNGLIITTAACDHCLHIPIYFFLLSFPVLDLGFISTTVPKSMANFLWHIRKISFSGCAAQVFLFIFFISAEYYLLTIMSYDRYIAICKPLHCGILLGSRACAHMAAAAWGSGFLCAVLCCTLLIHFHYHSVKAMLWTSSSVNFRSSFSIRDPSSTLQE